MQRDLISVIVPVYKVEKYLDRCIESIVSQTYKNLEIILVDDGSPDNCPDICDRWAEKDGRIKVFHKTNGGLSDARNCGMKAACGKYIAFLDSDDYIPNDYYERLVCCILELQVDIASTKIIKVYDDYTEEEPFDLSKQVLSAEEGLKSLIVNGPYKTVVWNKLYKKELVQDIWFPVGKLHEDEFFTYKVTARAERIGLVEGDGYYYRQRAGSIMDSWNIKHLDCIEALEKRAQFCENYFPNLSTLAKYSLFMSVAFNLEYFWKEQYNYYNKEKIMRNLFSYVKRNKFNVIDLKKLGLERTLTILKYSLIMRLYMVMGKWKKKGNT